MSMHPIVFAFWLVASSFVVLPPTVAGQDSKADTATAPVPDSQPSLSDSALASDSVALVDSTPSSADSLGAPQVGQADTGGSARDSSGVPGAADSTKARAAAAAPPAPVDSILSAACAGSEGSSTVAPNLLVVVFTAESGAAQRAAAARSIKGKLVGRATPVGYYIRVPGGGGEMSLRAYADQLSQLRQVREVGSRACPPISSSQSAPQRPS